MKMKKIMSGLMMFCFMLATVNVFAGEAVISAQDFTKLIKSDKSVVVIDANKADEYGKMHVINSVSVPHQDLYQDGPVEGLIKSPDALAKYFGNKGIANNSKIIIYDDGSNKYSSRVYWVLKYLGANDVRILHKDMDDWRKARVPITGRPSNVKSSTFTVSLNPGIIAEYPQVKTALDDAGIILVDARTKAEFDGTSETPASKGHIKSAINIDYKEFLQENGAFKSAEGIKAVAEKHGLSPDKEIILYCRTSVRAGVIYVALADILGYGNVKVYDGAYNEWVADASNPLN